MQADWLSLICPFCRGRFRIKSEHAHLRGRCPECGRRIEPPRPHPAPAPSSDGLEPIVAEWPEPAQREASEEREYQLAAQVPETKEEESYGLAPVVETPAIERDFGMVDEEEPQHDPGPPRSPASPGPVQKLTRAEIAPERAPPPPARPFLEGVYSFPTRSESLSLLVYLSLNAMLVLFFLWVSRWAITVMDTSTEGKIMAVGLIISITALCILYIASGAYVASAFLHVVEGTAAGNDRLSPLDWNFNDGFSRLLLLSWTFIGSALPGFVVGKLFYPKYMFLVMGLSGALLFPAALLSGLSAINPWLIFDAEFIGRALRKPHVLPRLYLGWIAVMAVTGAAVLATVWALFGFLIPITAVMVAASSLVGARLVGRAALLLTYEPPKKKKAKDVAAAPAKLRVVVHPSTCEFPQKELVALLGKPLAELESIIPFTEKNVELTETPYDAATHALDSGELPDLVHRFRRGDGARVDFLVKDGRIATALLFNDR